MSHISVVLLLLEALVGQVGGKHITPQVVGLFEEREFPVAQQSGPPRQVSYRLFRPLVEEGVRYPLIVWLHGEGEAGTDNVGQLSWLGSLIFLPPRERDRYPFFLLAVQRPRDWGWQEGIESRGKGTPLTMVDVAATIIEDLLKGQPIDPDRVVLSGVSSGGSGCWELAARYPELFAAVAPLASGGGEHTRIESLREVPVWAFHNDGDTGSPPFGDQRTVEALTAAGGRAHLTLTRGTGHDCWSAAFADYRLLDWLLRQQRGRHSVFAGPGHVPLAGRVANVLRDWTWWQLLLQAAVLSSPGLAILAWRWMRRTE
jgi:predicted peptidase